MRMTNGLTKVRSFRFSDFKFKAEEEGLFESDMCLLFDFQLAM